MAKSRTLVSGFNFENVVDAELLKYTEAVAKATKEVIPKIAKEAAARIRKSAPRGYSGDYSKSWTSMTEIDRLSAKATVYAKSPGYQIAHLLEHGHALRQGGRAKAIPHIKPVEEWAIEESEKRIREAIEGTTT